MIRYIFNLLIFLIGLAGAALWFGEMRHLRQAAGPLPLWTSVIRDDARVFNGSAGLTVPGLPQFEATWTGRAPKADGLQWGAAVSGDGVEAIADLVVPWWPTKALLRQGQGTVSLEPLTGGRASGLYRIAGMTGELPLLDSGAGYVEIQLDPSTPLPPEAASALASIGTVAGNTIRLPIALP